VLKHVEAGNLTASQITPLQKLVSDRRATADAWIIKEKLMWIQRASKPRGACWRSTHYLRLFVTSCGLGLTEQAAHRAANQIDHGDEVGLVPVATCA
jgi:hypothetical protein